MVDWGTQDRLYPLGYFVTTNNRHLAVSCEKGLILSFLAKERIQMANIDLNRASFIQSKIFE
jgi:hypothetical protein